MVGTPNTRYIARWVAEFLLIPAGEKFDPDAHIAYGEEKFFNEADAIQKAKTSSLDDWWIVETQNLQWDDNHPYWDTTEINHTGEIIKY